MLVGTALSFALAWLHGMQFRAVMCPCGWLSVCAVILPANVQAITQMWPPSEKRFP